MRSHRRPIALRELVEDFLLVALFQAADQVGRVVAVELGDALASTSLGSASEIWSRTFSSTSVSTSKSKSAPSAWMRPTRCSGSQKLDQIGKVGPVHVRYERAHLRLSSSSSASATARTQLGGRRGAALVRGDFLLSLGHQRAHSGSGGHARGTARHEIPQHAGDAARLARPLAGAVWCANATTLSKLIRRNVGTNAFTGNVS